MSYLGALRQALTDDPDELQNLTVFDYLEAAEAWLADSDRRSRRLHENVPANPTWAFVAEILAAGAKYE